MKPYSNIILPVLFLIFASCGGESTQHEEKGQDKESNTVKNLIENYSLKELETIYSLQTGENNKENFLEDPGLIEISKVYSQDTVSKGIKVLYGPDDRRDFYQETDPHKKNNSMGVTALIKNKDLSIDSEGNLKLNGKRFSELIDLCPEENFRDQPCGSFCTGFAIGPNTIITAGHCIKTEQDLREVKFIFDFKALARDEIKTTFEKTLVITGKSIISRAYHNSAGVDYAVIETNETIPEERILKISTDPNVRINDPLYVIGHPVGLPQKIAGGSSVRENEHSRYFIANLDTYGGNSGSPVFNSVTNQIVGILVKGETDFISDRGCHESKPCPNTGCSGEFVSRVSQFISHIPGSPVLTASGRE